MLKRKHQADIQPPGTYRTQQLNRQPDIFSLGPGDNPHHLAALAHRLEPAPTRGDTADLFGFAVAPISQPQAKAVTAERVFPGGFSCHRITY